MLTAAAGAAFGQKSGGVLRVHAIDLYGAFPVKRLFLGFFASSLFGAGKAVLRSLIAPQVSRGFCPLPA
jgi:hypothetical protein